MKFARTLSMCASVFALTIVALPVASSAQQQAEPATAAPAVAADPAAQATGAALVQNAVVQVEAERQAQQRARLVADAADLDAGEFVWRPELAPTGNVEIVVSIPQQRAYIYRANTLIGVTTVSTGMAGHRTPTGRYPIMEKHRTHFSNLYNNAPMPFMQRLTMGGIALHAGVIPGYPASHGCVRLPLAMARNLFGVTQVRSVVHIVNHSPTPLTALSIARGERPAAPMEEPVRGTR
jgi:lipoprotein-anchoring transpeptidase ErfK/SrfK